MRHTDLQNTAAVSSWLHASSADIIRAKSLSL